MDVIGIQDLHKSKLTRIISGVGALLCFILMVTEFQDPAPLYPLIVILGAAGVAFTVISRSISTPKNYHSGALALNSLGAFAVAYSFLGSNFPNLTGGYYYISVIVVSSTFLCGTRIGGIFLGFFYATVLFGWWLHGTTVTAEVSIEFSSVLDRLIAPTFCYFVTFVAQKSLHASIDLSLEQGRQLKAREKLSTLGVFVAGIAHEIRNPLAIIVASVPIIKRISRKALPEDSPEQEKINQWLQKVTVNSNRISDIIDSLLFLANDDFNNHLPRRLNVSVAKAISSGVSSLGEKIRLNKISIHRELAGDYLVDGNPYHLFTAIRIIIDNAADALKETTSEADRQIRITLKVNASGLLELRITDNGPGVPAEIKDKILDPFFTTKDIGKGSGIGLALVVGIANRLDWNISFDSTPGKTTFRVIFKNFEAETSEKLSTDHAS